MPRLTLPTSFFALAMLLMCANGCAHHHKPAEVPDFTEKGWSEPNPEFVKPAAVDTSIQPQPVLASAVAEPAASSEPAEAPKAVKPGKKKSHSRKKPAKKSD